MSRWLALFIVHLAWAALQSQCLSPRHFEATATPATYLPLSELRLLDETVVRLYVADVVPVPGMAVHPWFIVKKAGSHTLDRWEVWQHGHAPYGHVRKNLMPPEHDVGAGGVMVIAELRGRRARRVAEFIESHSPQYPCRSNYSFLGPNSNTYAQWVLDETGWRVALPPGAIGVWATGVCTQPCRISAAGDESQATEKN